MFDRREVMTGGTLLATLPGRTRGATGTDPQPPAVRHHAQGIEARLSRLEFHAG